MRLVANRVVGLVLGAALPTAVMLPVVAQAADAPAAPAEKALAITIKLTPEQKPLADEIRTATLEGKMNISLVRKPGGGEAIKSLAVGAEDPRVVANALQAMIFVYRGLGVGGSSPVIDATCKQIALARSSSADGRVKLSAIRVMQMFVGADKPDKPLIDRYLQLWAEGKDSPAQRHAIIRYLYGQGSPWLYKEPKVIDMLFAAMEDADVFVRVSALMASEGAASRVADGDNATPLRYLNAWIAGTKAKPVEARTVAAHILAVYAAGDQSTKPGAQEALLALLTDPAPGPRAAALAFVGDQNLREHKAALQKGLDDASQVMVQLTGFRDLAGTPNMLNGSLYPLEQPYELRHFAAQAVQRWAQADDHTLEWAPLPEDGDEDATKKAIDARVAAAKAWLAKLK